MRKKGIEMSKKTTWLCILAIVCFTALFSGCAAPRTPIFMDESLVQDQPEKIVLMPVVDLRKDKITSKLDMENEVRAYIVKGLTKKGYSVKLAKSFSESAQPEPEEILEMTTSELAMLGPSDSTDLFIYFLKDAWHKHNAIVGAYRTDASAILIDKLNSKCLWKDKVNRSHTEAGLFNAVVPKEWWRLGGIEGTIDSMLSSLPDYKKIHLE